MNIMVVMLMCLMKILKQINVLLLPANSILIKILKEELHVLFKNQDSNTFKTENISMLFLPTGSVLLFEHELTHEGMPVTKGTKYSVRLDVMYQK